MIVAVLLFAPLVLAAITFFMKSSRAGKVLLTAGALLHATSVIMLWLKTDRDTLYLTKSLYLEADSIGLLILSLTSVLFFFCSLYLCSWFSLDKERTVAPKGMKQNTLIACLLIFLFTMTLTAVARDMGMLWVAVEATTLASAPLINYHRSKGSLEAMWKYLLICSIGIGLALFGTMLIATAQENPHGSLEFTALRAVFNEISGNQLIWFKAGFVLCFAGYALKMGLAPFHTWLPDAYSESPSPISALLSAGLINFALLAIIRLLAITPDSLQGFANGYLKFFGFFSLAVAAFFIIRQKDFKRMLAYSSVEHMGLAALLLAYSLYECLFFHVIFHSLLKMTLFLVTGNILLACGSRAVSEVRGLFKKAPVNAALWVFGILLICGTPPSPLFFTELYLVREAGVVSGSAILLLLLMIFAGMTHAALKMCAPDGKISNVIEVDKKVEKLAVVPVLTASIIVILGVWTLGIMWYYAGCLMK